MQSDKSRTILSHFLWGVVMLVIVQSVFMGGGLLVETLMKTPLTGIPSMLGLTVVLFVGAIMIDRKSEYVLAGSFAIAFLSPLLLLLVTHFKVFPVNERMVYFSMGYLTALVLAVWLYFGVRMVRGKI